MDPARDCKSISELTCVYCLYVCVYTHTIYKYMCGWLYQRWWASEGVAKWSKVGLHRTNKIRLQVDMVFDSTANPHTCTVYLLKFFNASLSSDTHAWQGKHPEYAC